MRRDSFCIAQTLIAACSVAGSAYSSSEEESELCNHPEQMKKISARIADHSSKWDIENCISLLELALKEKIHTDNIK